MSCSMDRRTSKKRNPGACGGADFRRALLLNGSIDLAECVLKGSFMAGCSQGTKEPPQMVGNRAKASFRQGEKLPAFVVAERLFGYSAQGGIRATGSCIVMKPLHGEIPWEVELYPPQLVSPVLEWFLEAAQGIDRRIREAMRGIPVDSLTWADLPLNEMI